MTPTKRKLVVWAGTTFTFSFQWATPGETEEDPNVPVDMNGWIARMHVRPTMDSENIIISLTTENNRISIDGDEGTVSLELDADTTAGLMVGTSVSYTYDLELETDTGVVYKPFYGTFNIKGEVTREDD